MTVRGPGRLGNVSLFEIDAGESQLRVSGTGIAAGDPDTPIGRVVFSVPGHGATLQIDDARNPLTSFIFASPEQYPILETPVRKVIPITAGMTNSDACAALVAKVGTTDLNVNIIQISPTIIDIENTNPTDNSKGTLLTSTSSGMAVTLYSQKDNNVFAVGTTREPPPADGFGRESGGVRQDYAELFRNIEVPADANFLTLQAEFRQPTSSVRPSVDLAGASIVYTDRGLSEMVVKVVSVSPVFDEDMRTRHIFIGDSAYLPPAYYEIFDVTDANTAVLVASTDTAYPTEVGLSVVVLAGTYWTADVFINDTELVATYTCGRDGVKDRHFHLKDLRINVTKWREEIIKVTYRLRIDHIEDLSAYYPPPPEEEAPP